MRADLKLFAILAVLSASAAMIWAPVLGQIGGQGNPAAQYCTDHGGSYLDGKCAFPDGSSCDAWAFARGECSPKPAPGPDPEPLPGPVIGGQGNPAADFCTNQGYDYQNGRCVFPDGTSCEEWAFFRGECSYTPQPVPQPIGMPNPASVFCTQSGGTLEIAQTPQGEQGICRFPNGSSCEEWALYRGECKPQPQPPVGIDGTQYFTFQAVGVGETDLILKYRGPDGSVAKTETYHIVVTE